MAVELQRIWADERNHLGIRSPADDLGLLDLSPQALVERMVDPEADKARTDAALIGAAVGLQDHVRALIRSAQRAALDLTARLAPPSFDRSGAATLIPWRGAAAWRSYRDVYNALCGREGERSAETLRELMRAAYAREIEPTDRDDTP
jgi:predicted component of type VI protein secretion system